MLHIKSSTNSNPDCANSFIMMGTVIEEGAIIGANSSVYKNIKKYDVVGGYPAKFIKKRLVKYE